MTLADQFACHGGFDPDALPVEQARAFIRSQLTPLGVREVVPLRSALGRILARAVVAPFDLPRHDNSAMDGYALRHAELAPGRETRLRIAGLALAGQPFADHLGNGECVRIMTGGLLPGASDTIVLQEDVLVDGDCIVVPAGQRAGQHIRRTGEDLAAGTVALAAGRLLRAAELGLIASLGVAEVSVFRRLRVAFFSTGDELRSLGTTLRAGDVYDSNRHTIAALLARIGCDMLDLGVIADSPGELADAFRQAAAAADVVISSGGVSVGDADFVRPLMAELGDVLFWKVAMKPGRPLAFGRIGRAAGAATASTSDAGYAWLFGLPGNPVAVIVAFYQFVRDALYALMGADPIPLVPLVGALCQQPIRKLPGRTEFPRGVARQVDGQWLVWPLPAQGSAILRSMCEANCLLVLEPERAAVAPGEQVAVQFFDGLL